MQIMSFFKKVKQNYKLKLTSFSIAGLLLLTSCSGATKVNHSNVYTSTSTSSSESFMESLEEQPIKHNKSDSSEDSNEIYDSMQSLSIQLSEEEATLLDNQISTINVTYPFEEYYQIPQNLATYEKVSIPSVSEESIIQNNEISYEKLYKIVKENNRNFLENEPGSNRYKDTTDSSVQKALHSIVTQLNRLLKTNTNLDQAALSEKLNHLVVFESQSGSYAYYSIDNNLIGFDSKMIEAVAKTNQDPNSFDEILAHETNHLVQAPSVSEYSANKQYRFGPCYQFNDATVNSLYWDWFFEGTAERLVLDVNPDIKPVTYLNEMKALNTIKTATLLNSKNNVTDLENLSLQPSLSSVFDYFNCQTEEEKEEVVKMLYAFNLYLRDDVKSSSSNLYKISAVNSALSSKYGSKTEFKNYVKGSIGSTLSIQFYKNLTNAIVNQSVPVREVFNAISIFENEMSDFLWYNDSSRKDALKDFFTTYINVQNAFFETLSSNLNLSLTDVQEAYETYHKSCDEEEVRMSFIDNSKNTFYQEMSIGHKEKSAKKGTVASVYKNFLPEKTKQLH